MGASSYRAHTAAKHFARPPRKPATSRGVESRARREYQFLDRHDHAFVDPLKPFEYFATASGPTVLSDVRCR